MSLLEVTTALETIRILGDWIDKGKQFTCFNVSRELRRRGHNVAHKATVEFVHALFGLSLSDYGRFTQSFTTASGHSDTAEVYKRLSDTSDYDPDFDTGGATFVPSTS